MTAAALLSRLESVKETGKSRWIARCPAHDDRSPSLSIRELDDGRILAHCFAGCAVADVLAAVGLEFDALFPPEAIDHRVQRERRPFFPSDVFEIALLEITVIAVIASDFQKGKAISDADYARLLVACGRLNGIAEAAYEKR